MGKKINTDFLVASPSFVSGCARLFDWGAQYDSYNFSQNVEEADAKAIFSDWSSVGDDIVEAMLEYEAANAA